MKAKAAVLGGDMGIHQACRAIRTVKTKTKFNQVCTEKLTKLPGFFEHVVGVLHGLVVLGSNGNNLILRERSGELLEGMLFGGEVERQAGSPGGHAASEARRHRSK